MMSQFVYLEVITAADMFHICLHPDLLAAFSGGLCPVVPCDKMECDNREGKDRSAVSVASIPAPCALSSECAPFARRRRRIPTGKLAARAAPGPSMPSSWLPSARMHGCTYQGIALSISPSGLQGFAPTQSLYAHMHRRGDLVDSVVLLCSGHLPSCFFFLFVLLLSLYSSLYFKAYGI